MALLFMDGFDYYGNTSFVTSKWASGTAVTSNTFARTGTYSLRTSATVAATTKAITASGGAIVGFAFYANSSIAANDLVQIIEGGIVHVAVGITVGGLLTVKRGSTVLATGTTVLSMNNWYYIELKTVIHDTTGTTEVRIDGVVEANLNLTGQDTQNAGTGIWDRVLLQGVTVASATYMDDFYICDTSGSAPQNTFLGLVKIELLMPQTDAVAVGSNTGLTPSTGTDHGALVDEVGPNTTDYNSSATVGLKDTYNYPAMTLTGTVLGVQTNLYCAKSDAGARQVCAVVRSNSVDYDGANISPATTFQYYSEIRQVNPNTSAAWTTTEIASIQAGMKVTV